MHGYDANGLSSQFTNIVKFIDPWSGVQTLWWGQYGLIANMH